MYRPGFTSILTGSCRIHKSLLGPTVRLIYYFDMLNWSDFLWPSINIRILNKSTCTKNNTEKMTIIVSQTNCFYNFLCIIVFIKNMSTYFTDYIYISSEIHCARCIRHLLCCYVYVILSSSETIFFPYWNSNHITHIFLFVNILKGYNFIFFCSHNSKQFS